MKSLIVYAHPSKSGNCGEIFKITKEMLPDAEIIDLHSDGFDPVLTTEEYDAIKSPPLTALIKEYQDKIRTATDIILIYPIWWNGTPAILKGFFDRVLTTGFAYRYNSNGMPVQLLKGRRGFILSTSGAPDFYRKLIMGDMALKVVAKTTLGFCGIKSKYCCIGNARDLDEKGRKKIQQKVQSFITKKIL